MSFDRKPGAGDEIIIKRAVGELADGMLVNLGIGLPTFIPAYMPTEMDVTFHSENGFTGMGPPLPGGTPDHDVIDAGGRACTLAKGAACFDSAMSFALVRGGHVDMVVLGAFEVSVSGDLANWNIPGKLTPGMGGAMELAQKAKKVVVISRHTNRKGAAKLKKECTLPLTAPACVDTLITERGLFRRKEGLMTLTSVPPGTAPESARQGLEDIVPLADPLEEWSL